MDPVRAATSPRTTIPISIPTRVQSRSHSGAPVRVERTMVSMISFPPDDTAKASAGPVSGPITAARPELSATDGQTYPTQWMERERMEHVPVQIERRRPRACGQREGEAKAGSFGRHLSDYRRRSGAQCARAKNHDP